METKYKEFSITISSEHDENLGLWNGLYRILDNEGVVAYESFVEPQSNEDEANENAKKLPINGLMSKLLRSLGGMWFNRPVHPS